MSHPKKQFLQKYKENLKKLANIKYDILKGNDIFPKKAIEKIKNLLAKQWTELTEDDHEFVDSLEISEEEWPSDLGKLQEILVDIYDDTPKYENVVQPLFHLLCYIVQRVSLEKDVEKKSTINHFTSDQIFDSIVDYSDLFCDYYLLNKIQCPSKEIRLSLKNAIINNDQEEFCRVFETNHCDSHDLDIFLSSDLSVILSANNDFLKTVVYNPLAKNLKRVSVSKQLREAFAQSEDSINLLKDLNKDYSDAIEERYKTMYDGYEEEAIKWYPKYGEENWENHTLLEGIICIHLLDFELIFVNNYITGQETWTTLNDYKEEGKLLPFEISIIDEILNRPGGKELVEEWEKEGEEGEENSDINEQDEPKEEPVVAQKKVKLSEEILNEFFKVWPLKKINATKLDSYSFEYYYPFQRFWLNKQVPWGNITRYNKPRFVNDAIKKPLEQVFIDNFKKIYTFLTEEGTIENSMKNCKLLFYRFSGVYCDTNNNQDKDKDKDDYIIWEESIPTYACFIRGMINDGINMKKSADYFRLFRNEVPPFGKDVPTANEGYYHESVIELRKELDTL